MCMFIFSAFRHETEERKKRTTNIWCNVTVSVNILWCCVEWFKPILKFIKLISIWYARKGSWNSIRTSHLTANKSVSIVCEWESTPRCYWKCILIRKLTTNCLTKQYLHFTNWMQRFRLIETHKMYTTTSSSNNIMICYMIFPNRMYNVRRTKQNKTMECNGYRSMICGFQCKWGLQLHIH